MAVATMPRRQIYVRPRSELITVLNWRQVPDIRTEKWRSETCLDANFFEEEERPENTRYVCGSYELTRGHLEESEDEMAKAKEIDIPDTKMAPKRSELTINLRPASVKVKPRLAKAQSMANLPINSSGLDRGYTRSNNSVPTKLNPKRKSSLDVSLAKLRHEMNSLRRQDMELFEQLLSLNNSIQDFKLSQYSSPTDMSDSSSDECETETVMEKPLRVKRWHSRGSLASDGSGYHSASSRSSIESNPSLNGSDVASYDSGHESGAGLKSCRRRNRGKFGSGDSLRRVSFGSVSQRLSGSEIFSSGSDVVFPAQAVRRNSEYRVAEIRPIKTLSKRQSTIW